MLALTPPKGFGVAPGPLRGLGPLPDPANKRLLALLALLLLLLLLLLLGIAALMGNRSDEPTSLDEAHLVGSRGPVPVNIALAVDVSPSFQGYDAVRRTVLEQVLRWAPENLRDDDTLSTLR